MSISDLSQRASDLADEPDGPEQVALDQERIEARDPAIGVDLVEHQGVLNGRARVRHALEDYTAVRHVMVKTR